MSEERMARCPACNKIHAGGMFARRHLERNTSKCELCGGSKKVSIEVAKRYLAAMGSISSESSSTIRGKTFGKVGNFGRV